MVKETNQNSHHGEEESKGTHDEQPHSVDETLNEQASTYQPEVSHPEQNSVNQEPPVTNEGKSRDTKTKKIDFDFDRSLDETKSIVKDAVVRPHSLISSHRSISIETSAIILVLLAVILGVFAYFSMRNVMDNMFGGLGSLMGGSIGFEFLFKTILAWILTFAVGYLSLYFMLSYFGNRKMEHKLLMTKYVILNIPFVLVFCVVFVLFGLLLTDLFIVMYLFSLMLFGMIHIYLFLVNVKKPKFDLFWLSSGYLFVLILATYYLAGMDIPGF